MPVLLAVYIEYYVTVHTGMPVLLAVYIVQYIGKNNSLRLFITHYNM